MDPLRPGDPSTIGRYRLIGRLGEGGMGRVFLGVSPGGRQVAVKLIYSADASDRQFRERFTREIESARSVGGFHTASVVDADPTADPPWMVTAYIHGASLAEAVRQRGPFSVDAVCALGAGLAEGLAAIHACDLVHRDLKPSNVILADDGPRIIDFGIARTTGASRMTAAGMVVGTYSYMSPEQVRGQMAGPASDVFSLGCTLAFAATAQAPFGDDSIITVAYRITSEPPDLSHVPTERGLRQLISQCLAKNAEDRPSLNDILDRLTQGAPQAGFAAGPVPGYTPTPAPVSAPAPAPAPAPPPVPAPVPAPRSDEVPTGRPTPAGDGVAAPGTLPLAAAAGVTAPPVDPYAPTHIMHSGERLAEDQVPGPAPELERSLGSGGTGGDAGGGGGAGSGGDAGSGGRSGFAGTDEGITRQGITPPTWDGQTKPDLVEQRRGRQRSRRPVVIVASVAAIAVVGAVAGILLSSSSKPGHHQASGQTSTHATTSASSTAPAAPTAPTAPEATLHDPNGKVVFGLAFGPNDVLATGDANGSTYLWSVPSGKLQATLADPNSNGVNDVAYSSNSNQFVAADASGYVYLWNATTHKIADTLHNVKGKGNDAVAVSQDGAFVAVGNDNGSISVWSVAAGQPGASPTFVRHDPYGKAVYGVAFSPNGSFIAAGDTNGTTYLYSVATGQLTHEFHDPSSSGLYDVRFSPDGTLLAVSDTSKATSNGVVYLWNVATGKLVRTLQSYDTGAYAYIAFSPDGRYLAAASTDGNANVWNVATGALLARLSGTSGQNLVGVAFSLNGDMLATSDNAGDTYVWSMTWLSR